MMSGLTLKSNTGVSSSTNEGAESSTPAAIPYYSRSIKKICTLGTINFLISRVYWISIEPKIFSTEICFFVPLGVFLFGVLVSVLVAYKFYSCKAAHKVSDLEMKTRI